ncbi:uncharacterized protein [Setaria viridis]|uniref:uncharacterized protein n=1 Tax=Setaria viridis TaxID=4556 RepID=UPI003B3AF029
MVTKESIATSSYASAEEMEKIRSALDAFIAKQEDQNRVLESSLDKILSSLNNLTTSAASEDKGSASKGPHQYTDTPPPEIPVQVHQRDLSPWSVKVPAAIEEDCPWTAQELEKFYAKANTNSGPDQTQLAYEAFLAKQQANQYHHLNQHVIHPNPTMAQQPYHNNLDFHQQLHHEQKLIAKGPKLSFPAFDGSDPDGWIRKAEKYFELVGVLNESRVQIAVMYIVGKAEFWWRSTGGNASTVPWHQFCKMIGDRFNEESLYEVIARFHGLKQNGPVQEYITKFEELMGLVKRDNPSLHDSYFISSFISGLQEPIQHHLQCHQHASLNSAFWYARRMEQAHPPPKRFP